jgi:hypothetical protein
MTSDELSAQHVALCLLDATPGSAGRVFGRPRPALNLGSMSMCWRLTAAIPITAPQPSVSPWLAHSPWLRRGNLDALVLKPDRGIMTGEYLAGGESRLGGRQGKDHVDDVRT